MYCRFETHGSTAKAGEIAVHIGMTAGLPASARVMSTASAGGALIPVRRQQQAVVDRKHDGQRVAGTGGRSGGDVDLLTQELVATWRGLAHRRLGDRHRTTAGRCRHGNARCQRIGGGWTGAGISRCRAAGRRNRFLRRLRRWGSGLRSDGARWVGGWPAPTSLTAVTVNV